MSESNLPWYRYRWPWLLFAGPAIVVVAAISTAVIAVKTEDSLVNDNYYKKGKEINEDLARDNAAARLGLRAQMILSDDGSSVRVLTNSNTDASLPDVLKLSFQHPTREGQDVNVELQRQADNVYVGKLALTRSKHWYLRIEDPAGQWRVEGEWKPAKGVVAMLVPSVSGSTTAAE